MKQIFDYIKTRFKNQEPGNVKLLPGNLTQKGSEPNGTYLRLKI